MALLVVAVHRAKAINKPASQKNPFLELIEEGGLTAGFGVFWEGLFEMIHASAE